MIFTRLGTRFELDEEKILRENEYDLKTIYNKIEEIATQKAKLTKIAKNHYEFRGEANAPAYLGILVFNFLLECEWFTKNVKKWEWLGDSHDPDYVSDLITSFKKDNMGIWN